MEIIWPKAGSSSDMDIEAKNKELLEQAAAEAAAATAEEGKEEAEWAHPWSVLSVS